MTENTSAPAESGFKPSPYVIERADGLLKDLQQILSALGKGEARGTPIFHEIMGIYKDLGADLHQAKKLVQEARPAQKKAEKPVARLHQSLLGMVKDKVARQSVQDVPASPARAAAAAPLPEAEAARATAHVEDLAAPEAEPAKLQLPKFEDTMGPGGKGGVVSMGEEIAHLQQILTHLGYPLEETEIYDKETLEAVQAFQKDHGLDPTGLVGADMRGLLNQLVTG